MEQKQWEEMYKWIRGGADKNAIPEGSEKEGKLILHALADERDKLEDVRSVLQMFTKENDMKDPSVAFSANKISELIQKIEDILNRRD